MRHAARAGLRGADAANDADAVVLDRLPALHREIQAGGEGGGLDVVDRRFDTEKRWILLRDGGDAMDFAIEETGAAQRQGPLPWNVDELDRDAEPTVDDFEDLAADDLVGNVGDPGDPQHRLAPR